MTELEKFKKLPHINSLYEIVDDWGYAPNLYHFDGDWHVTWIHCEEGDGLDDFIGDTPEEAINKAYEWFHGKFNSNEPTPDQDEKNIEACRITVRNSYLKCLYGDEQLAWVFFNGMAYGRTGKTPKDLLDDEDFINGSIK